MRPVDKGKDRGTFKPYGDAQEPLKSQLGKYCSYCERWIASAIHVEHKLPKSTYVGRKFRWTNFLLSCSNCNSGKGHGQLKLANYLWPDTDNTALAFTYDKYGRVFVSSTLPSHVEDKAKALWLLVGLNKHTDTTQAGFQTPTPKDDRWQDRKDTWTYAARKKASLAIFDTLDRRDEIAVDSAQRGLFSVWMTVFSDDADMRRRLISAHLGTATSCFNRLGQSIRRHGSHAI